MHEHRRHRAATLIEVGFDCDTLGVHIRVRTKVKRRVGREDDGFEELVQALTRDRGHVDELRVAAVLFGDQAVLGELATHPCRVCGVLIDLVHRDDDRHVGSHRVVHGLDGLRHHAVVGGNHQHSDVRRLRASGTHGGEGLVTRGIDEGDGAFLALHLGIHLVGTNLLRDATGLTRLHVRVTERIEQLGFTVVDVAHDGNHRRTNLKVVLVAFIFAKFEVEALQQLAVFVLRRHDLDVVLQLRTQQFEGVVAHRLGGGDHLTHMEKHLHECCRVNADLLGEIGQRRTTTQTNGLAAALTDAYATDRWRLHLVKLLATLLLRLATTVSGTASSEGALRSAAATTTTRRTHASRTAHRWPTEAAAARPTGTRTSAASATTAATGPRARLAELARLMLRHHRGVGARHASRAAGTRHQVLLAP